MRTTESKLKQFDWITTFYLPTEIVRCDSKILANSHHITKLVLIFLHSESKLKLHLQTKLIETIRKELLLFSTEVYLSFFSAIYH